METIIHFFSNQAPLWSLILAASIACAVAGFLLAARIWGSNRKRLKTALDDSSYLAGQWATLGISQSQFVEKLSHKLADRSTQLREREISLNAVIREREETIAELQDRLENMEDSRTGLSEREVEALQMQVTEIQKRDSRIRTLEARLQFLDSQNEQNVQDHQKQVRVLLQRIAALEENSGGQVESEISENNRQLTELLEHRCRELEELRDEFYAKEEDLTGLREQNATLKKSVDDLVASWAKKKNQDGDADALRDQLAETRTELAQLRKDYEKQEVELKVLREEAPEGESGIATELVALKSDLEDSREELNRSSAQIDVLLNVIENRDLLVEELERQLSSDSKQSQVQALSQTIADLQSKLTRTEDELSRQKQEATDLREQLASSSSASSSRGTPVSVGSDEQGRITERKASGKRWREGEKSIIYFGENSAYIKTDSSRLIKEIARDVIDLGCQLSVLGFAENEGTEDFNETISTRRAEAVRERFEAEGVDASLVMVKGNGQDPKYSNSKESWKARRVEIVVLPVAEIIN